MSEPDALLTTASLSPNAKRTTLHHLTQTQRDLVDAILRARHDSGASMYGTPRYRGRNVEGMSEGLIALAITQLDRDGPERRATDRIACRCSRPTLIAFAHEIQMHGNALVATTCWLGEPDAYGPTAGCTPDERTFDLLARHRFDPERLARQAEASEMARAAAEGPPIPLNAWKPPAAVPDLYADIVPDDTPRSTSTPPMTPVVTPPSDAAAPSPTPARAKRAKKVAAAKPESPELALF